LVRTAVDAIRGIPWQPYADRPMERLIIPSSKEHLEPALLGYMVLGALLLMFTPVAFGISSAISKARWDEFLARQRKAIELGGVEADASVVYKLIVKTEFEYVWVQDPVSPATHVPHMETRPKFRYVDHFEFRFNAGGTGLTKVVDLYQDTWSDEQRFFDPDNLKRAVSGKGEALATKPWWKFWVSSDELGHRLARVRVLYDPSQLTNPGEMRIVVPEHPPRSLVFRHIGGSVGIVITSLLSAGLVLLVLVAGYYCFAFFLGAIDVLPKPGWKLLPSK
jgi:hypothetical protein